MTDLHQIASDVAVLKERSEKTTSHIERLADSVQKIADDLSPRVTILESRMESVAIHLDALRDIRHHTRTKAAEILLIGLSSALVGYVLHLATGAAK